MKHPEFEPLELSRQGPVISAYGAVRVLHISRV
jgi:hypothetical protein